MLKSLYFKIVLILLIFIVAVMCAVGAILMNGVSTFYSNDFFSQMESCFSEDGTLISDLNNCETTHEMKNVLSSYGSFLGIDQYRNYYILDKSGNLLDGSDSDFNTASDMTPNLISAISGKGDNITSGGMDYSDWAVRITTDKNNVIIYVKDSLVEMRNMIEKLVQIIIQALIVGVLIAVLLSFFLAKSISSPIQTLTYGTQMVAEGEFSNEIDISSEDEIGELAESFNTMRIKLRDTIEEVNGEREKLDTVLKNMRDAVLAFANDGSLLHSNSSAEELFETELKTGKFNLDKCFEMMDIPLEVNGSVVDLPSPDGHVENTRDGYIFHDRIFNSRVYDVSFAIIRYVTGNNQASGCLVIIHDTTARYELDESRREFVANVSHELKTPLTSIKAAAETVRMDPEIEEEMKNYFLDIVLSESDRMSGIVSDLLILSRLDDNRTKWNIEEFDVKNSIKHIIQVMISNIESHHHTVSFGCDKNLPKITGDKQRLEQVFINILSNAVKYTPDNGHLDVKIQNIADTSVLVTISDNGVGISEEDLSHLFERFYRVEKSRTHDAGGTGLGLAIAKELVEAHGGTISISSKLGQGTSVSIELPVDCKLKNTSKPKNI